MQDELSVVFRLLRAVAGLWWGYRVEGAGWPNEGKEPARFPPFFLKPAI